MRTKSLRSSCPDRSRSGAITILLALSLVVSIAGAGRNALAQSADKGAENSIERAKEKLKALRSRGVTVFYPGFVPSRFSLVSARTATDSDCPKLDYVLEFCDKNRLCFSIESACGGIGDGPDGDRTLTGKSKSLGPFSISVLKPGSEGNDTRHVYYISTWLEDDKMKAAEKRGAGEGSTAGRFHHFLGHGVTDKEAIAIVESLMPLK